MKEATERNWERALEEVVNRLSKTLRVKNGPQTPHNIKNYHCTVKGCTNNNIDGPFTGNLCNPCHEFITTGTGRFSQAFRNQKAAVAEAVADERERLAALLGEMHVKAGGLHNYYERAAKIVRANDISQERVDEPMEGRHEIVTSDNSNSRQPVVENTDLQRDTTWNGWILREVYFENGEPLGHRERPWVGLTDEERRDIREWKRIQEELGPVWAPMMLYLYEAIEAKLKEKNGG